VSIIPVPGTKGRTRYHCVSVPLIKANDTGMSMQFFGEDVFRTRPLIARQTNDYSTYGTLKV
jgi:hypothetical protein